MRTKNIIVGIMCFVFAFSAFNTAHAQTTQKTNAELIKTIEELRAEIRILKAQLNGNSATSTAAFKNKFRLNQEFGVGATSEEIKNLQKILATDPSIYPEGMVTGYFGPLTSKAVSRLQTKYQLENRGLLTSETRDFINSILEAYGIEDAIIPADFLTSGPARIKFETEVKDGKMKYKFKIKNDDDSDDEDDSDEDDSSDDDQDEDDNDDDEDEDDDDDDSDED